MNNLRFFILIFSSLIIGACSSGGGGSGNTNANTSSSAPTEASITLQLEGIEVKRLENDSEESVEGLPIQGTKIKFN